jgi:hypothetical protein
MKMKKYSVSALIPALLIQVCGCYSMKEVTREEFIQQNSEKETLLITKDGPMYQIDEFSYSINLDTINVLKGTVSINQEIKVPFSGEVAVADVTNFIVLAIDGGKTTLLTFGIMAGAALIVLYVLFVEESSHSNIKF